jgi:hypothetical protein
MVMLTGDGEKRVTRQERDQAGTQHQAGGGKYEGGRAHEG